MLLLGCSGINSRLIKYLAARGAGNPLKKWAFLAAKTKFIFELEQKDKNVSC